MAVRFHGPFGSTELMSDLLVQFSAHHQREDFGLALRQRRDQGLKGIELFKALLHRRVSSECALKCCQQYLFGHGFGQEIFRTGLDGAHACRNIAVARHKNDWPAAGQLREFLLELKAVQTWHLYVEQDATWSGICD